MQVTLWMIAPQDYIQRFSHYMKYSHAIMYSDTLQLSFVEFSLQHLLLSMKVAKINVIIVVLSMNFFIMGVILLAGLFCFWILLSLFFCSEMSGDRWIMQKFIFQILVFTLRVIYLIA